MGNRSKRRNTAKEFRRTHRFDMSTAEGREAARHYRMEKYRKRMGLTSGGPSLQKLVNADFAECPFTISYQR